MLVGKDEDIDLALVNWLIVADIPQFAGMSREDYSSRFNQIADLVRKDMQSRWEVALSRGKSRDDPETRVANFLRFNYQTWVQVCRGIRSTRFDQRAEFCFALQRQLFVFGWPDCLSEGNLCVHADDICSCLAGSGSAFRFIWCQSDSIILSDGKSVASERNI